MRWLLGLITLGSLLFFCMSGTENDNTSTPTTSDSLLPSPPPR